jgi:hypothetical protein
MAPDLLYFTFSFPLSALAGLFVKKLFRIDELIISLQRVKESGEPEKGFLPTCCPHPSL